METKELSIDAYFRRQMTAIGATAMEQIGLMHVLVVGLRGCGLEIAKCLVMSGVQRLTLMDDELVRPEDLGLAFLLRQGDQGKSKAKLVASRLNELSPFADVRTLSGHLSLDLVLNFHVVVFASAHLSQEEIIAYDEFCRVQTPAIGIVVAESRGFVGSVFTDFSPVHRTLNAVPGDGDIELTVLSKRTAVRQDGSVDTLTVAVKEPLVKVYFGVGDLVALHSPSEPHQLLMTVVVIESEQSLRLTLSVISGGVNLLNCGPFTRLRRVPTHAASTMHRSYRECLLTPGTLAVPTGQDTHQDQGRARSLHMALMGYHAFKRELGVPPCNHSTDHCDQAIAMIHTLLERNTAAKRSMSGQRKAAFIERDDVDDATMKQVLRFASSELLPLSALVAGYAALQVLKFSGALGSLVHRDQQFVYFDELEMTSGAISSRRGHSLTALVDLFGCDGVHRLRNAAPLLIGTGPTNMELLKNLLCMQVGADARMRIALDPDESPTVDTAELANRVLLSPQSLHQGKQSVLTLLDVESTRDLETLSWDMWASASVVAAEVASPQSRLIIDEACVTHGTAVVVTSHENDGFSCVSVVAPHRSATLAERMLTPEYVKNPSIFAFDYLPSPTSYAAAGDGSDSSAPIRRSVVRATACFQLLFSSATLTTQQFFEKRHAARRIKTPEQDDGGGVDDVEDQAVWLVWSVVQRANNVRGFEDCIRVAWTLLELLPIWLGVSAGSGDRNDERSTTKAIHLLHMNLNDPHHTQLLVAIACLISESVGATLPRVDQRKTMLEAVAAKASFFSLEFNPRTVASIRAGFDGVQASHILEMTKRVHSVPMDLNSTSNAHCHFVQALANVQQSWNSDDHARVVDLPHVRRLCSAAREFPPMTTINGALVTLQVLRLILLDKAPPSSRSEREHTVRMSPTNSAPVRVTVPPQPLSLRSISLEVTRGVSLRLEPEGLSRWTRITLPTSTAVLSVKGLVQYVETKYAVTVHSIHHRRKCIASAREGFNRFSSPNIFDLCGAADTQSFVLLDVAASDARGDVHFAPMRVNRVQL